MDTKALVTEWRRLTKAGQHEEAERLVREFGQDALFVSLVRLRQALTPALAKAFQAPPWTDAC